MCIHYIFLPPITDEAACLRNGVRKAEKRKLGILELATKEFEDESEVI